MNNNFVGFYQQYNSVRDDLWKIVNQRLHEFPETSEIFISGHSMGGALTILCALDLAHNKQNLAIEKLKIKGKDS